MADEALRLRRQARMTIALGAAVAGLIVAFAVLPALAKADRIDGECVTLERVANTMPRAIARAERLRTTIRRAESELASRALPAAPPAPPPLFACGSFSELLAILRDAEAGAAPRPRLLVIERSETDTAALEIVAHFEAVETPERGAP